MQLEHAHERYKLLETHSAGHKRELDTLREKNRQLSDALSRHQGNLSATTHELLSSREQLAKTEVSLHSLRAEHASLQQREKQARSMYEDVLRERKNQNMLLVNLQVYVYTVPAKWSPFHSCLFSFHTFYVLYMCFLSIYGYNVIWSHSILVCFHSVLIFVGWNENINFPVSTILCIIFQTVMFPFPDHTE